MKDVRKMFNKSLRSTKSGNQEAWTEDQLLAGFEKFREQYDRLPTAHEIDKFDYLPSSRSIQRSFGGLQKLRQKLLPNDIDNYTKGKYRSIVASNTYAKGRQFEEEFYDYLITQFLEMSVHEHKVIRPGQVNSDFYIYLYGNKGVVIDIFYADSIINLVNVVNIKLKRYKLIDKETYLVVVGNPSIKSSDLKVKINNRRDVIPSHITVITEEEFKSITVPSLKLISDYALE